MRSQHLLILMGIVLALSPTHSVAQTNGKTTPGEKDIQSVRTRPKKRPRAALVNFGKAYNLHWKSLHTLGGRIDASRSAGDPVSMSHLANEMHVAEKVSGKKAALTSAMLLKESAELAKLRKEESELKAILEVAKKVQQQKKIQQGLIKSIEQAKTYNKQLYAKTILAKGRLHISPVHIENYSNVPISIFMNGRYQFTVQPLKKRFLNIVQQPAPVTLYGYSTELYWGPRMIYETLDNYTWALLPVKQSDD